MDWESLWDKPTEAAPSNVVNLPTRITTGDTPYALAALRGEAADVARAGKGNRNDALNRAWFNMGRHIIAGTIAKTTVVDALTTAARSTGLPEREIETTLRDDDTSGLAKAAAKAGPRIPPPLPDLPTVTILDTPDDTTLNDFWTSREILTHLHTYARARCVAPWATLGNALARVIGTTSPAIALPPIVGGYASLNLFVGIVGRSGSGKGAAEAVAKEAIDVGELAVRNTGSGEGAVHAYMKRTKDGLEQHTTAVLFSIPEIDSLGAVGARQGATIMSLLRSGWSGEQLGFQYADPAKNLLVPAHKYRMCLVAGIQPGRAGTLLDDEDGGTPQRFLWLPAIDPDAPEILPSAPKPMTLHQREPVVVGASGVLGMEVCATARQIIVTERRKAVRGEGDALDGHALLTRLKVAAGLALMDKRRDVNDEDWQLSGVISGMSDATRSRVIAHRQDEIRKQATGRALAEADRQVIVTETVAEKAVARVARGILRRLDDGEMAYADARKRVAQRDRDFFEDAVEHLVKAGQIAIEELPHGARISRIEAKS